MRLLIVESPAKAKTISKYLNGTYKVVASVGHIRDLPKSNKKAIDIEGGFVPHYETVKAKEHVLEEIKKLAEKADEVVLATDPDREGEAIAWHVKEVAGLKNPKRIVFHEITEEAVAEAIRNPRAIDDNLRKAQEARRVLDRLVGYDLSGLIWKKVRYGLSAGRVQSPALRILMEREREIRAFIPEDFWVLTAEVETKKKEKMVLTCAEEPKTQKDADRILEAGKAGVWRVTDVEESDAKRSPRAPFTTSTLQQAASTRLGFAPSRTMQVAQRLYEAGHITYMRTDSTTLAGSAVASVASLVKKEYGENYLETRVYKTKSKAAQEAHEAIRPTHVERKNAGATPEQKKLYALIWQRTVSSQMADAKIARTKIVANIEGGDLPPACAGMAQAGIPDFSVTGSRVTFDGWLRADPDARGEDVEVPKVKKGDSLVLLSLTGEQKQTQPPSRYTEAGLIKELEKRGIGRPSTYASIMKTLADRGYVTKEGRTLTPTDTGDVVSTFLEKNFTDYVSDTFTAEMEDELDEIAEGKREYEKTLRAFYTPFRKDVRSKEKIEKLTNLGPVPKEFPCPICGGTMVYKLSKNGKFMSCSLFPKCTGARTAEGKELDGPKILDEKCPQCSVGQLIERDGRFGRFVACANYPKCKYVKRDASLNGTGVKCLVCAKGLPAQGGLPADRQGEMVERRGRFGPFYSCSNYPDCKNAIKAKPTGNICTLCGSLMMEGTKTIPERCSNKACPNHNPHKLAKVENELH